MCEQMKTLKQQIKMLLRDAKQYNWLSLETGDAYDQLIWEPGPDCGKGFPSGKKRGVFRGREEEHRGGVGGLSWAPGYGSERVESQPLDLPGIPLDTFFFFFACTTKLVGS